MHVCMHHLLAVRSSTLIPFLSCHSKCKVHFLEKKYKPILFGHNCIKKQRVLALFGPMNITAGVEPSQPLAYFSYRIVVSLFFG